MTPYRDVFGNPLRKKDVILACQIAVQKGRLTALALHRSTQWGLGKAGRIVKLLQEAGVLAQSGPDGKKTVLLRTEDAAVNAALRQLKKGRM